MNTPETPEQDYGPESQFDQTVAYLDRLLDAHGTAPLEGELHSETVDRRLQIDPDDTGYILKDIYVTRRTDGMRVVRETYRTYEFDPTTQVATRYYQLPRSSWTGQLMEPRITVLDDEAQRNLIVTISNALHNGKVVPQEPLFPSILDRLAKIALEWPKRRRQP